MPTNQPPSRSPLTFQDLVADLVWPSLLRAGSLAVRPGRVALGFVWLIGVLLLMAAFDAVDQNSFRNVLGDAISDAARGLAAAFPLRPLESGQQLHGSLVEMPAALLRDHPIVALLGLPILLAWTSLFGGAIARSAACDFSLGQAISWPQALGFSLSRWRSLFGAFALPLVLVWFIAFGMAVGGLLFRVGGFNVAAALAWGLFLLGGLVIATILIALALGQTMLAPAIACEGTDAIDAVQHAYAYVFARPLRLILYSVLLFFQGVIVTALALGVAYLAIRTGAWASQGFAGGRGTALFAEIIRTRNLEWLPVLGNTQVTVSLTGSDRVAGTIIRFWCAIPILLAAGVGVSVYWTSCTLLYLAMRRICDGQDMHELWSPGMIEGTVARATASGAPAASQGVSESGPADDT